MALTRLVLFSELFTNTLSIVCFLNPTRTIPTVNFQCERHLINDFFVVILSNSQHILSPY